jgi:methyl-accepting chemotaxis protein
MSNDAARLISSSGSEKRSFVAELSGSISTLVSAFRANEQAGRDLAAAVGSVTGMIRELSAFVNDIEEIGSEVRLIAINAQIKAARVAEDGGALGVLAEAIRNLSDHATEQTLVMADTLREVGDAAIELHRIGSGEEDAVDRIDSIKENVKELLSSLRESDDNLVSLLNDLDRTAQTLTRDIEAVMKGITAHSRTTEVVRGVVDGLRNLVAGAQGRDLPETPKGKRYLEELMGMYTMVQERHIHESHARYVEGRAPETNGACLGDNIELF